MALDPNRFFKQVPRDLKLWLFCIAFLEFHRLVFIFTFRDQLDPATSLPAIALALLIGARFDLMVAAYWVVPSFVLSLVCVFANWETATIHVRRIGALVFAIFSPVLCTVSLGYYKEFHDLFGPQAFGIYYDDAGAVMKDLPREFNIIPIVIATIAVAFVGQWLVRRLLRWHRTGERTARFFTTPARQTIAIVVACVAMVIALRASWGPRPIQVAEAGFTRDEFLNKTVINPYVAARNALKQHFMLADASGIESLLPGGDIRSAVRNLFADHVGCDDLDSCMARHAKGPKGPAPRHIFIIVEETYDMWPMLPKYASLRLTEGLKSLADSGLFLSDFLPASDATMLSLAAIITGLADAGLVTNYQKSAAKPYPSSLPMIFRQLGFKTTLFYGGYLTWQRFGDFARAQGFEEVYGARQIPHEAAAANEWGIDDQYLFNFMLNTINDSMPTFSLVMSTSYHPPFSVDVYGKGYPVAEVPDDLRTIWGNTSTLKMFGHLWWADRCLTEFVRAMDRKVPLAVFAMTGDHSNRKFINSRPSYYEHTAVPLVMYGPSVLHGLSFPANAAGSHLDIGTTLIELTAPEGFTYHAMGQDLLAPRAQFVGIGRDNIMMPDYEVELGPKPQIQPLPQHPLPSTIPDIAPLKQLHDEIHAISWWRIKLGPKLPAQLQARR